MSLPDYMIQRPVRPLGISLLSILHFVGGLLLGALAVAGAVMLPNPDVAEGLSKIGIPLPLLAVGIVFLVLLGVGSAIGMWQGARWGWYLGSFYYSYSIVRNLTALIAVGEMFDSLPVDQVAGMTHGVEYYYVKFGGRVVVSFLIYLYFFKTNVRAFFGLQETNKWPAIAIQICVCIGIAVAATVWGNSAQ